MFKGKSTWPPVWVHIDDFQSSCEHGRPETDCLTCIADTAEAFAEPYESDRGEDRDLHAEVFTD